MNNPHRRRFLGRGLGAAQLAVAGVLLPAACRALASAPDTLARYRRGVDDWLDRVAAAARRGGASYVRVDAEDEPESVLLGAWRREGVVR